MDLQDSAPLRIRFDLLTKVEKASGIRASACFQCRKCTNGCPLTAAMDLPPDQVVRLLILGQESLVLECATIWVCSACETCTTRCPNEIDIAGLMDFLKQEAHRRGIVAPHTNHSYAFHRSFVRDIARRGRVFEGGLVNDYLITSGTWKEKLQQGTLWDDLRLGAALLRRRRMPLVPRGIKNKQELEGFFSPRRETDD